ncbi:MAG TPA: nitrilase-related carbon-nitrogen hydrolase [Streptosporangiaceae bacterium]|nr:nitrilase-related carbon-nitrogen hydrolase [Streptosporangiaceae bacterium]
MRIMLAAIQCEKGDIAENLSSHLRIVAAAASAGCDLVLFPEMSLTGSVDPAAHPQRLISLDHAAVGTLARASGEHGVGLCFGVAERAAVSGPHITQVFATGGQVAGVRAVGALSRRARPLRQAHR